MVVPAMEEMTKLPSYPPIPAPEITIGPPTLASPMADARVTVTTLPDSLIEVMAELWLGPTFGSENANGLPMPLLEAGLNAVMISGSPFTTLPALVTKMRDEFPTS